ncbi:MAG TPA: ice-binding family protein [Solirubrobacterales bacterium]|nr:ice-binding family protein [Solirubrobacterales bacterium]
MSSPTHLKRGFAGMALAVALALAALPAFAQAAPVNLATAGPFVVLGGATATNTGASVLNGDLGVSPGTTLPGFEEAVVNGVEHVNDGVAAQAQLDLTTAYNVAAGTPVLPANDLSGTDLGNRVLTAGAYRYTSDAQLTNALILDAQGDPNAQFVFEITSALTTAPGSSVLLVNGASPCNVYWQVGSSATLDTTTAFQGNVMALESITVNNKASVLGRLFAREGQISLDENVLTRPLCPTGSGTTPTPTTTDTGGTGSGASANSKRRVKGNQTVPRVTRDGTAVVRPSPREACTAGFRATVRGHRIDRVVFSLDGQRIGSQANSPFAVYVKAAAGQHQVRARITFNDATRAKTMTFPYRACAAASLAPRNGPSQFTG